MVQAKTFAARLALAGLLAAVALPSMAADSEPPDSAGQGRADLQMSRAFAVLGPGKLEGDRFYFVPFSHGVFWPHAVAVQQTIFCIFQNDRGQPVAMAYQTAGKRWQGPVKVSEFGIRRGDAHGTPSLCVDRRGYLHVFYGCHTGPMRYAKSAKPLDITQWQEQPAPAPYATYPQVMRMADGSVFLFYRAGGHMEPWTLRISNDDCSTWGPPQPIVEMRRDPPDPLAAAYCSFLPGSDGRTVHLFWNHKDDNAARVTDARPHPWRPLKYPGLHEAVYRYNLYYLKRGADEAWRDATGREVELPVSKAEADRRCLVYDSGDEFTIAVGEQIVIDAQDRPFTRFETGVIDWTQPKVLAPVTERFAGLVGSKWQVSRRMPAEWPAEVARIFRAPGVLIPNEQWPGGHWFIFSGPPSARPGLGRTLHLYHDEAGYATRAGGPARVD